jgi:hypothetical protein
MTERTKSVLRFLAASILPPVAGTGIVYAGTVYLPRYGWILFLMLPFVLGFASSVIYAPKGDKPYWKCFLAALSTMVVLGGFILAVAIEGAICLVMAVPLAAPLVAIGALSGLTLTQQLNSNAAGIGLSALLFVSMPFFMGFEASQKSTPTVHQVVSTVEIDAPIETVWRNVVEFPQIDAEPEGILKLGFAYPINAKIEGEGIGAVRYCNFNTGPFVEPITVWQEPHLLAFDVKEQPAPMTELTPYEHLHAAHLEYIRSQKGQFRLYEKDGKTIVEGTTFYTHDIAPDFYWRIFSDEIIHQIHLRVLNHIKVVSERDESEN